MATRTDLRRIALALPGAAESDDGSTFSVDGRAFAWPWLERVDPKRARVPNLGVLVARVASEEEKQALLALDDRIFFTEPHFDGYAAVLVRLEAIDVELLAAVLEAAWRTRLRRQRHART